MKHLLGICIAVAAAPALAQHDHGSAARPAAIDPHAGHAMPPTPSKAVDPHAGHQMTSSAPIEAHHAHTGHEPGIPDPPVKGPSAAALSGPNHAADAIFGAAAMAPSREIVRREHGDIKNGTILIDQLEAVIGKGKDGYAWDAHGWYGGDINRLWLKTEGESRFGESLESVEAQVLWGHALDPWWNLQAGVRHDFR